MARIHIEAQPFCTPPPEFLQSLRNQRFDGATVLKAGRNSLYDMSVNNRRVVVKSFDHVTVANRVIYGTCRKSKGQRSYEHARRLLAMAIDTPLPLGYMDVYAGPALRQSFYVCEHSEARSLSYDALVVGGDRLLEALAHYVAGLHRRGVLHHDLNSANVMMSDAGDRLQFTLIDLNRLAFTHVSEHDIVHNISQLFQFRDERPDLILAFLRHYASAEGYVDPIIRADRLMTRLRTHYVLNRHRHTAKVALKSLRPHTSHKSHCS